MNSSGTASTAADAHASGRQRDTIGTNTSAAAGESSTAAGNSSRAFSSEKNQPTYSTAAVNISGRLRRRIDDTAKPASPRYASGLKSAAVPRNGFGSRNNLIGVITKSSGCRL